MLNIIMTNSSAWMQWLITGACAQAMTICYVEKHAVWVCSNASIFYL